MKDKDMREILLQFLGVRCVFPSALTLFSEEPELLTARCMLEYGANNEKTLTYDESSEDIIARLKYLRQESNENIVEVSI